MSELQRFCENEGISVERNFLKFPESVIRVKIDVGLSHDAVQSFRWLKEDPSLGVVGIEPLNQNVSEVRQLIKANPDAQSIGERFVILPIALGEEIGTRAVFVTEGDAGSSSFFQPKIHDVSHRETVPVFRLKDVLELISTLDFPRIDFIKTDCQGSDLDILKGASNQLERVAIVTAEAEDEAYVGTANSEDSLDEFMSSMGFVRHNPRSPFRRRVGSALSRFNWIHVLYSKFKKIAKRRTVPIANRINIRVEDPTYINSRFLAEVESGGVTAFQEG
jgi:FkbM family methyltransferase